MGIVVPLIVSVIYLMLTVVTPFTCSSRGGTSRKGGSGSSGTIRTRVSTTGTTVLMGPGGFVMFLIVFCTFLYVTVVCNTRRCAGTFKLSMYKLSRVRTTNVASVCAVKSVYTMLF